MTDRPYQTREQLAAEVDRLRDSLMRIEHATADVRKSCIGEPGTLAEKAACAAYDEAVGALND